MNRQQTTNRDAMRTILDVQLVTLDILANALARLGGCDDLIQAITSQRAATEQSRSGQMSDETCTGCNGSGWIVNVPSGDLRVCVWCGGKGTQA